MLLFITASLRNKNLKLSHKKKISYRLVSIIQCDVFIYINIYVFFKLDSIYTYFVLLDFISKDSGKTYKINKAFFVSWQVDLPKSVWCGMI